MPDGCYLAVFVNARQLNYTDGQHFVRSMESCPDFGHAWLYMRRGREVVYGGHSGELGRAEPRYFDGVMLGIVRGDPNPARYFHKDLSDGFFQYGSGGHEPTYAIQIDLSHKQWDEVLSYIDQYDFGRYSLSRHQCVDFVTGALSRVGVEIKPRTELTINREITVYGETYTLWNDPGYAHISFSAPELLEEEMRQAVTNGQAQCLVDRSAGVRSVSGRQAQRRCRSQF